MKARASAFLESIGLPIIADVRPSSFREWVLWRIARSATHSLAATRANHPPAYLLISDDEAQHELSEMIGGGELACSNGRYWLRARQAVAS